MPPDPRRVRDAFWRNAELVNGPAPVHTHRAGQLGSQDEMQLPLFFGLAIQAYESTLISDDSPYRPPPDGQQNALTSLEQTGLAMFSGALVRLA
jgi:hypothetical protein